MKITKIRAVGPTNVDFPVVGVDPTSKFILQSFDGLGPVDVAVLKDGTTKPGDREIVLLVGLNPNYFTGQTAEQLRTELYGLMTPRYKSLIRLEMFNGASVVAYAEGQVKKMEPTYFNKDPQVQITIKCLGATKSFLMAPQEQFLLPTISGNEFTIDNPGSAPSGFEAVMVLDQDVTDPIGPTGPALTLYDVDDPSFTDILRIERTFDSGDIILINTNVGSKSVHVYPGGSGPAEPLIEFMTVDSFWKELHSGVNNLALSVDFHWADEEFFFGFKYTPRYWGV